MKRVVFALFSIPGLAAAAIVASAGYRTPGCNRDVFHSGEFAVAASLNCGSDSVTADGSFDGTWFRMHTAGSYDQGSAHGSAYSLVTFDFPVVTTGTDQPGYVVVFYEVHGSSHFVAPSRYQWVAYSGTGLPPDPPLTGWAGFGFIPFTPGVPFHLSGTVQGFAGNAIGTQRGEFAIDFGVTIAGFTSLSRPEGEPWQLYQIEGVQAVVVPEPWPVALVGFALLALKRYASPRARPRST